MKHRDATPKKLKSKKNMARRSIFTRRILSELASECAACCRRIEDLRRLIQRFMVAPQHEPIAGREAEIWRGILM
jgi:hypothetical protein